MGFKKNVGCCALGIASASLLLASCSTNDVKGMVNGGSAVSTVKSNLNPTKQNLVKIYYSNKELPKKYKVVGRVSVENYNVVGMTNSQASIAEALKKQAASIGANGIINVSSGLAQTTGDAIITK